MPEISNCPRCDKQVSLPLGADPQSRVRCPLCDAEYLLADSLALAPPMLVLLDAPRPQAVAVGAAQAGDFAPWGDEDDTALEIEPAHGAPLRASAAPTEELSETVDAEDFGQALTGPDFGGESLSGAGADDAAMVGPDFDETLDGAAFGDELNEFAPSFDDAESADGPGNDLVPASDPFAFGDGPAKSASAIVLDSKKTAAGETPSMAPLGNRRRRKKPSIVRQLISVVGGGVCALPIVYFILLWMTGNDIIGVATKLPAFMVPKKFHAGGVSKVSDFEEPKIAKDQKEKNKFDFGDAGPGELPVNVKGAGLDPFKEPKPGADVPPTDNGNPGGADPGIESGPGDEPDLSTPSLDDPIDPLKIGAPSIDEPKLPPASSDPAEGTEPAEPAPADEPTTTDDPAPTDPIPAPASDDTPPADDPAPADPAANTDDPATDAAAPATDGFLVQGRAEFTADQLKEAIELAKANQDALLQGSLDNPQFKKTKVGAYLKFCKLADTYTFTKLKSGERKSEMLNDDVKGIVLAMIDSRLSMPDIEKIGEQWLKSSKRTEDGALIVGTVLKVEKAGKVYATTIRCGTTPEVVLLSSDRPFWKAPESIIALGTVVEQPTKNLIGYEGPASIAVFTSMVQPW